MSISAKRHLCLLYRSLSHGPLHLYCTIRASSRRELAGRGSVLCTDSHAGADRHDMSAPRVPSESNAGGLYKDVFLQIPHCANIQKLPIAWQAGCPSGLKVPRCQLITALKRSICNQSEILLHQSTSRFLCISHHTEASIWRREMKVDYRVV